MSNQSPIAGQQEFDCVVYLLLDKDNSQKWLSNVNTFLERQNEILLVLVGSQQDFETFKSHSSRTTSPVIELDCDPSRLVEVFKHHLQVTEFLDLLIIRSGVYLPAFTISELKNITSIHSNIGTISPLSDSCQLFRLFDKKKHRTQLSLANKLLRMSDNLKVFESPFFNPNFVYWRYTAVKTVRAAELLSGDPIDLAITVSEYGKLHVVYPSLYVEDSSRQMVKTGRALNKHVLSTALINRHPLAATRKRLSDMMDNIHLNSITSREHSSPTILHIMHSWGGGLHRWVSDFIHSDELGRHYVLKSIGDWGSFGKRLALYHHPEDEEPIRYWDLYQPIHATAPTHLQYTEIARTIINEYGIDRLLVSSLIGHSLDILNTETSTTLITHDYYPFCPAIYTYFNGICSNCDVHQLDHCQTANPLNYFFRGVSTRLWIQVRKQYAKYITQNAIDIITPSQAAESQLKTLMPDLNRIKFHVIPHGIISVENPDPVYSKVNTERLKILVLGRLDVQKGLCLFQQTVHEITQFADLVFLGSGSEGNQFSSIYGVTVEEYYEHSLLNKKLKEIEPDLGLLLSIWPETFSYTLSELKAHAIPTIVSAHGAPAERIHNQVNGFLVDTEPEQLLSLLKNIADNPNQLEPIKSQLLAEKVRTAHSMTQDYHTLFRRQDTEYPFSTAQKYMATQVKSPSNDQNLTDMIYGRDFFQTMAEFQTHLLHMVRKLPNINEVMRILLSACIKIWFFIPVNFASWYLKRKNG